MSSNFSNMIETSSDYSEQLKITSKYSKIVENKVKFGQNCSDMIENELKLFR